MRVILEVWQYIEGPAQPHISTTLGKRKFILIFSLRQVDVYVFHIEFAM